MGFFCENQEIEVWKTFFIAALLKSRRSLQKN